MFEAFPEECDATVLKFKQSCFTETSLMETSGQITTTRKSISEIPERKNHLKKGDLGGLVVITYRKRH